MHRTFTRIFGADLPVRHRGVTTGLLASVILLSLFALPRLEFEDDIQRGFASDSANSRALAALVATLDERPRDLVVLVESAGPFSASDLDAIRTVSLDMEFLDSVAGVLSPFVIRRPSTGAAAGGAPVFPPEIVQGDPYDLLAAFEADYPEVDTMIAADRGALILAVAVAAEASDPDVRALVGSVETLAENLPPTVKVTVTGEDAIAFAIVDALKTDLFVLSGVGNLVAFLLSLVMFRGLRPALVAFVPAAAAALVSLAVYPLLGYPVTVFNVIIPILILILAVADAMHLTWHLQSQSPEAPLADRLAASLAAVGPANALTSLTTACGFAAIGIAGFEQFDELAAVGVVSVLAAYAIVIAGVVVLAPLADDSGKGPAPWLHLPKRAARWPLENSGAVIAVGCVIAVIAGFGAYKVEPWFPLYQNLPDDDPVREAHRTVENRFGGYLRLWFEIDGADETDAAVGAVTQAVREAAPEITVISAAALAEWGDDEDAVPARFSSQLSAGEGTVQRVVALVPEPMHDRETRDIHDGMVAAALAAGADRAIGFPMILREDSLEAIAELGRGLVFAWLLATAVVALVFASPALFVLLTVPNVLPLAVTTAALHGLNGGQINMSAVLGLTVAFAIAIDDSIHFVNRYAQERDAGAGPDAALATAMSETGRVMIATTLLISLGLVATFTSGFPTVRLFGAMMILTFVTALVADLLLLPALIQRGWWRR